MKKIIIFVLFLFVMIVLSGCKNKYNAKIYGNKDGIIPESFLINNPVKEAHYIRETEDGKYESYTVDDAPEDRTFIITEETTLNSIVKENSLTIDFDKKMVLLYLYCYYYPSRQLYIKKIMRDNKTINISFTYEHKHYKDNNGPTPLYALVVLDKLDVETCNFTLIKNY